MNYYLNRIYFGKGYFGVGRGGARLLRQGRDRADRAGVRAAGGHHPRADQFLAARRIRTRRKWRRDATLRRCSRTATSTHEEYSRASSTPVRVQPAKPSGLQTFVMAAAVKEMEQILSIEGTEEMPQGLTVRTNIDLRLQRAIESR